MENKYLVKICALLKPPAGKSTKTEHPKKPKAVYKTHPASKTNKYTAKISKQKQRQGKR